MQITDPLRSPLLNHWDLAELRYSFVWEDIHCLTQALRGTTPKRILSIGSAGDNAFALLLQAPEELVILDLSPAQMALIELKKAAIATLEFEQYMGLFTGDGTAMYRLSTFNLLQSKLSKAARYYWEQNQELLLAGVDRQGRLDRYFEKFRRQALPALWKPADFQALVEAPDLATQLSYWQKADGERLARFATQFFSAQALSQEGRHASQFTHVKVQDPGAVFLRGFNRLIQMQLISQNPYLYYFLTGRALRAESTHPLWNPKTYADIQSKLGAVRLVTQDLESFLRQETATFDFMNLSDIFEYLSEEQTQNLFHRLRTKLTPKGALTYWTLLVERQPQIAGLHEDTEVSRAISLSDRTWFYSGFHLIRRVDV